MIRQVGELAGYLWPFLLGGGLVSALCLLWAGIEAHTARRAARRPVGRSAARVAPRGRSARQKAAQGRVKFQ